MGNPETGKNPGNSTRQPLTGLKLWWKVFFRLCPGESVSDLVGYYKDSAFPACPACGSPNVVLTASRRGQSYRCPERDCKSKGACEVEGSNGIERRKARVRTYVFAVALLVLVTVLFLTGHLAGS